MILEEETKCGAEGACKAGSVSEAFVSTMVALLSLQWNTFVEQVKSQLITA